jgi:hypothetical protein
MADKISFTPTKWVDKSDGGTTPLSAAQMNRIESGISTATSTINGVIADYQSADAAIVAGFDAWSISLDEVDEIWGDRS